MKQSRRAAWGISAIAGVLLLATGCTAGSGAASNGSGKAPYVLGVLTSQTGGASQLGMGEMQGAQLAADNINRTGGVNGHKIQLQIADDTSTPDQALQQARLLLSKNILALIGPSVAANCNAVGALVAQNGPVDYCLSPGIKTAANVWSSSAKTDALAEETMKYWKSKGITKVAILNSTDASGTDGGRATTAAAAKVGVKITAHVTYDPTAVSATSQLQKAMAGAPQALVVWSTGTPMGVALKGIQQLGITLPVMTTDGNLSTTFLKRIADYMPDTLLIPATRDFWWETLPKTGSVYKLEKEYHEKYQAKYGEAPDFGPGVGYDAVMLIAAALKKADSTVPAKIHAALESLEGFDGVVGTYHMSAQDHRGLIIDDVAMVQAKDGKFTYVGK